MTERLLTAREVAKLLGLSTESVLRRWRAGEIPGFRIASMRLPGPEPSISAPRFMALEARMPADQQGQVYRTTGGYGLRWYDEHGALRRKGGFSSPSKARAWFRDIERPRMRGDEVVQRRTTFSEHVDEYLAAHAIGRDASTIKTLTHRLGYATATFGELQLADLERRAGEIATWTTTLPGGSRYGIVQVVNGAPVDIRSSG